MKTRCRWEEREEEEDEEEEGGGGGGVVGLVGRLNPLGTWGLGTQTIRFPLYLIQQ